MQYLVILNYDSNEINYIELSDEEEEKYNEDAIQILEDWGLNPDMCDYMWADCEPKLEKLERV